MIKIHPRFNEKEEKAIKKIMRDLLVFGTAEVPSDTFDKMTLAEIEEKIRFAVRNEKINKRVKK